MATFPYQQPLPIDIYGSIFRYMTTNDLTVLCRVSKTFQDEAERILYYAVDITHITDGEHLMSWCHAVVKSPQRAFRVHTLYFPAYFAIPEPKSWLSPISHVQPAIGQAFRATVNLDELSVRSHLPDLANGHPSLLFSAFEGCKFSLSALSGVFSGFSTDDVWRLLLEHPNIRYWAGSDPFLTSISSIPQEVLPNVTDVILVRPNIMKHFVGRPIKRLVWVFQTFRHTRHEGIEAIIPLEHFKLTLTHLHYTYMGQDADWTAADIIGCLTTYAPNLTSLSIGCFQGVTSTTDAGGAQKCAEAVSGFRQLETLQLDIDSMYIRPSHDENPPANNDTNDASMRSGYSLTECCNIAILFMKLCPTLHHVSLQLRDDRGQSSEACCFVRSEDHRAKLEGIDTIDTTSWWMK